MAKRYRRVLHGVSMWVTVAPHGGQWGVEIDGESRVHPQVVKGVNYAGKPFWRLRPGSLPGAFDNQFHTSLNAALHTIARLYKEWNDGD